MRDFEVYTEDRQFVALARRIEDAEKIARECGGFFVDADGILFEPGKIWAAYA